MSTAAPEPGVGRRQDDLDAAQVVLTIKVRGEEYLVAAGNVPMRVRDYFELQTGRSVEYIFSTDRTIGVLQVALACYLAVILRDEKLTLRWAKFRDDWPTDLTEDDFDVTVSDPESPDPEA